MRWQEVGLIPVTNASHAIGRLQCAIPWVTHRGFTVSVIRTCCGNCARNSRCRCDHISETLYRTNKKQTAIQVSSDVGDKTIHELYLWPLADAVHAGLAVSCAHITIRMPVKTARLGTDC